MFKRLILAEVIKPFLRRVGSIMAGSLMAFGFAEDQSVQVAEALVTIMLIGCDLVMSYWERNQ
jgi:hypothetical protein